MKLYSFEAKTIFGAVDIFVLEPDLTGVMRGWKRTDAERRADAFQALVEEAGKGASLSHECKARRKLPEGAQEIRSCKGWAWMVQKPKKKAA